MEGLQRSSTIYSILNDGDSNNLPKNECNQAKNEDLERTPYTETVKNCSVCSHSMSLDSSLPCTSMTEEPGSIDEEDNSKALVPFQKLEAASSSISLLVKELPELRPGWPLLRRTLLSAREGCTSSSSRDISVVQWTTLLPSRPYSSTGTSSSAEHNSKEKDDDSCDLGVQNNAMVSVSSEVLSHKITLDEESRSVPKELEGLQEKYSSTCRLFKYTELQSATSNFMPGLISETKMSCEYS